MIKKLVRVLIFSVMLSLGFVGFLANAQAGAETHGVVSSTAKSFVVANVYKPVSHSVAEGKLIKNSLNVKQISSDVSQKSVKTDNVASSAAKKRSKRSLSLAVWGNYCGPGHSGPGEPVDVLDAACMHHDNCYARKGYFNCDCDQQLIDEINRNYSLMGVKAKIIATGIKTYFSIQKIWCNS